MVFRTIGIYAITSTFFLRFLRFFQNPKSRDFLRFCCVSYVFSNYDAKYIQFFRTFDARDEIRKRKMLSPSREVDNHFL